ncbi:hypothetical protein LTS03_010744 [Exophiala xenobiotica]|nr:hypothetical protein LTS06_006558 [Exophiala xenobiotica]KAK5352981.1 hypothetical protein LTR61_004109 [Exophiala xenobiotica]KAK5360118.1 hypothetical protein LTS03_010744 [Exophiala xenobiotica]KAK5375843.1 hypothetical protein LTR11_005395 [Exophiala xenobiotica]KAK5416013.1 hypothetical protein LTR06_004065 [Exophiala xenobiotica]
MAATEFSKLPSFDSLENKRRFWAASARSEIITGEQVCLNWDIKKLETPGFGREAARHVIKSIPNYEGIAWDDEGTSIPKPARHGMGSATSAQSATTGKATSSTVGTTSEEIK